MSALAHWHSHSCHFDRLWRKKKKLSRGCGFMYLHMNIYIYISYTFQCSCTYHIHFTFHIHIIYICTFIYIYMYIYVCFIMFQYAYMIYIYMYVYIIFACMFIVCTHYHFISQHGMMYVQKRRSRVSIPPKVQGIYSPKGPGYLFPHLKRVVLQGCKSDIYFDDQ